MEKVESGARVYLLDGRECEYIGAAGELHVVASLFDTEYGEESGEPFTVPRVYLTLPTEKLHAEVAELTEKATVLRQQAWEAQSAIRTAERDTAERLKKLAKFNGLELVEDFIDGRITHFVVTSEYGANVQVQTLDKALKANPDREWDREMKLLCLFGDAKGNLSWRRNQYRDGSGSGWDYCEPFTSEAAAVAYAQTALKERLAGDIKSHHYQGLLESCAAVGVEVPGSVLETYNASLRASAENAVAEAAKRLEAAQTRLASLAGSAP